MKTALRNPLGLAGLGVAVLVALAMTFAYLGAFLDPEGNTRALPILLVNEKGGALADRAAS